MTHEELHEPEYSNLQAAIEHVRTAPLEFMLQVMWDKGYSQRLRIEAAKAALPFVYGPPTDPLITSDDDPRLAELLANIGRH